MGCSLRFADVSSKLIPGIGNHQFVESTIRDGISMICKGYTEADNRFLKPYDANKPTSYIIYHIYLDATSMKQLLPTEIRDWVNPKDFNLGNYSNGSSIISCSLKVDLDYPDELHDLCNDIF